MNLYWRMRQRQRSTNYKVLAAISVLGSLYFGFRACSPRAERLANAGLSAELEAATGVRQPMTQNAARGREQQPVRRSRGSVGHAPTPALADRVAPVAPDSTSAHAPRQVVTQPAADGRVVMGEPMHEAGRVRRVKLSLLQRRLHPGLCSLPTDRAEVRRQLMARCRSSYWGDSRLWVDPRLPEGAHLALLSQLEQAEREVRLELGLVPVRPDVFVYGSFELMGATSCIDADVVAYHDGALHVLAAHSNLRQSVLHQYAHHALGARGVLGPTWAVEGVAMFVAREAWWREPRWLKRVASSPLDLAAMEAQVPDLLPKARAARFYAQAAAMVACAARAHDAGVIGFIDALGVSTTQRELTYLLPDLAQPSRLRDCLSSITH